MRHCVQHNFLFIVPMSEFFSVSLFRLFLVLISFSALSLVSCEFLGLKDGAPVLPFKKVYAPGEIRAEEVEKIALSEVGKREGTEINFRSDGVQDSEGLYYVSVTARPYKTDGRRTIVVDEQGDVVEYYKGNRLPKYRGRAKSPASSVSPASCASPIKPAVPSILDPKKPGSSPANLISPSRPSLPSSSTENSSYPVPF